MTRRILMYQEQGTTYLSQEFNGDRAEGIERLGSTPVTVNWADVAAMFAGPASLEAFQAAVERAETAFTYEHVPLETSADIPAVEELWRYNEDGTLTLFARYGEPV